MPPVSDVLCRLADSTLFSPLSSRRVCTDALWLSHGRESMEATGWTKPIQPRCTQRKRSPIGWLDIPSWHRYSHVGIPDIQPSPHYPSETLNPYKSAPPPPFPSLEKKRVGVGGWGWGDASCLPQVHLQQLLWDTKVYSLHSSFSKFVYLWTWLICGTVVASQPNQLSSGKRHASCCFDSHPAIYLDSPACVVLICLDAATSEQRKMNVASKWYCTVSVG